MNLMDIKNKLFHDDALAVLKKFPDSIVDVGVTSPPYNKGERHKGWLVKNVKYDTASDNIPEGIYQSQQIEVLNELFRVTKPGGSFFYNHKTRWNKGLMLHPIEWLLKTKWNIRQEIIWDRIIAANIRGWRFWQVDERIYWLQKPRDNDLIGEELKAKHALLTSIWRFPPAKNNSHPAPFPLKLPLRAIFSILNDRKGLVIDPYCGSGTTLVATKLLGCDYVGIDISSEYIKESKLRLANANLEKFEFEEEIIKHIVKETFKERKENGKYVSRTKKLQNVLFNS